MGIENRNIWGFNSLLMPPHKGWVNGLKMSLKSQEATKIIKLSAKVK